MTQHFLLSAKASTLSVRRVFEMNDEQVFKDKRGTDHVFPPQRVSKITERKTWKRTIRQAESIA